MNEKEAAQLLGYCAAFDNRKPSQAAAVAWSSALQDVPLDADAKAAIDAYYTTAPKDPDAKLWILPHHVRTLRAKIRSARLENFQYEPIVGETTAEYLTRYRGQIQSIASGQYAATAGRLALEGNPSRQFMSELEARGWQGNRTVDEDERPSGAELWPPRYRLPDLSGRRRAPLQDACGLGEATAGQAPRQTTYGAPEGRQRTRGPDAGTAGCRGTAHPGDVGPTPCPAEGGAGHIRCRDCRARE